MQKDAQQPSVHTSNRYRWDRAGKRTLAAHVPTEAFLELKRLGQDQKKTTDAMVHEALALLLQRHNRPLPSSLSDRLKKLGVSLS
jgi:hypothetical protein